MVGPLALYSPRQSGALFTITSADRPWEVRTVVPLKASGYILERCTCRCFGEYVASVHPSYTNPLSSFVERGSFWRRGPRACRVEGKGLVHRGL